jgi:hypothetical protein
MDEPDWYYLSFSDPKRPRGTQFLGACFVRGTTARMAVQAAWNLKCNPGGEVTEVGPISHLYIMNKVPPDYREVLLSKEVMTEQLGWELERMYR